MTTLFLLLTSCSRSGELAAYQPAELSVGQELNAAYCSQIPWILVGSVVKLDSYRDESLGNMVTTSVSIQTVSVAKGAVPRRFKLDIAGGEIDGVVSRVNGMPNPVVDSMYLWMVTHFVDSTTSKERVVLMDCYPLDAGAAVPDSAALKAMWGEQCTDKLETVEQPDKRVRPFLPGVPFLPDSGGGVFGECRHM
jgi:hypothetical protein